MATAKVTVTSMARRVRITSVNNQPKEDEMYNRQTKTLTPTSNVSKEDKLLSTWQKMQEANKADQRAKDGKFNSVAFRKGLDNENKILIELKRRKEKKAKAEERKYADMMKSKLEEDLRLEQEKSLQKKLQTLAIAENQKQQMKEKKLLKQEERLQKVKYAEYLCSLDEQHAQDLRREAEKKAGLKKKRLQNQLEEMARRNLNRKREVQILRKEEQKAKQDQLEMERQRLQRKAEGVRRFRNLQTRQQIVGEKLKALQEEKAATMALKEEQRLAKDLARRESELAKQQKEEEENKAAMIRSIAAHRQSKIRENKEKERAERQSIADWNQAYIEDNRLFLAKERVKAKKIREDKIKVHNYNVAVAAEKRVVLEELKREKRVEAKKAEEFAVKEKQRQKYINNDLHDAAENLPLFEESRKLKFKNKQPNKVTLGTALHLPPIPNAARSTLASPRGGFASPLSVEGSKCLFAKTNQPLPRCSSAKPQHIRKHGKETRMFDQQQFCLTPAPPIYKLPSIPKLPPIPDAVKQSTRKYMVWRP